MSCPYCLAFRRDGDAVTAPVRRTLVRAYWEFEQDKGTWLGFSPAVSGLLEASFQNWMDDPIMQNLGQIQHGSFLYNVDYGWMVKHRNADIYQRIRRVGVAQSEDAGKDGSPGSNGTKKPGAKAGANPGEEGTWYGTVDSKMWADFIGQVREAKLEITKLKKAGRDAEIKFQRSAEEHQVELDRLREELEKERRTREQLEGELQRERTAMEALIRRLDEIWPGRLVKLAEEVECREGPEPQGLDPEPGGEAENDHSKCGSSRPGDIGRVRALEGQAAFVDFVGLGSSAPSAWWPTTSLNVAAEAELLMRPGSRTCWQGEQQGQRERGVVCDVLPDSRISVLAAADGRRRAFALQDLEPDASFPSWDRALEPGDLVRADGLDAQHGDSRVCWAATGVVLRREPDVLWIRFRGHPSPDGEEELDEHEEEKETHVDVALPSVETAAAMEAAVAAAASAGGLPSGRRPPRRDLEAERMRPGAAVQLAAHCQDENLGIGVVYALHGDGVVVVDFLSCLAKCCDASGLRVVERPSTLEHALLRFLSGTLASWQDASAPGGDETIRH